jgi:hypothetical protein
MPNSRTTRETSLPPPSLGISRGGGEEEEEAPLAPPAGCRDAVVPPLPLVLSALRRLLFPDAPPPVCLLYASPPVCLLFAS